MGVVKRQGIKMSIVSYFAVLVGAVNTLVIYPTTLEPHELGLLRFIIDSGILLSPFIALGLGQISVKYFPQFKDKENGHNGFLFFLLCSSFFGIGLFLLLCLLFNDFVYQFYESRDALISQHLLYIIPFTCFYAFQKLFTSYTVNFKRIAVPNIFNNLFFKLAVPALTIAYFLKYITLGNVLLGLSFASLFINLCHIAYVKSLGQWLAKPNFKKFNVPFLKEMGVFGLFGMLNTLGTFMVFKIDSLMLASFGSNTLTSSGIYTIPLFIANSISIPTAAIWLIASPLVSQAWEDNNLSKIRELYIKSSINLLIIGVGILALIWASIDDLFAIMPKGEIYAIGKYAVLILGITKLFDMATSINEQIIGYSKHYRFNFYALILLAVLTIVTNLILIPKFEIIGAALATMISIFLYNMLKYLFILWKMKMQPFSLKLIWVLVFGVGTYYISQLLPSIQIGLPDLVFKSIFIIIVYGLLIYFSKISLDINNLIHSALEKVKK